MTDFFIRTEDIRPDEVAHYFVETAEDRKIIDALKGRNPTIVVGSRGVGKSFLLRMAEFELSSSLRENGAFPVYVSFSKSSLVQTSDPEQFKHWMLSRILANAVRALSKAGIIQQVPSNLKSILGEHASALAVTPTRVEMIADAYESSWLHPGDTIDLRGLPHVDEIKAGIEDLCDIHGLRRVVFLIDEAAHVFLPKQQREFFTLFRDLRSPFLTCNAAVYPGVTSFGEAFQPSHDATMLYINRDVLKPTYVANMREIVERQAESGLLRIIEKNLQNFSVLCYAASGNPRLLLKTLSATPNVSNTEVSEVVREFYRTDIWSEHSNLSEKYAGHRQLVDWGRKFIETSVLPDLVEKNKGRDSHTKGSTAFFWIHRDAPQQVKEALRLLAYTGIVTENGSGIKVTRGEIGTRYMVNIGCVLSRERAPAAVGYEIAQSLSQRRMAEYGANHPAYKDLIDMVNELTEPDSAAILREQLNRAIDVLDLSDWMKGALRSINLRSVGDVLQASESDIQKAYYVGEKRSRRMRNAAIAAVLEFLSG